MIRTVLLTILGLASVHVANGQCDQWYRPPIVIYVPVYPVNPPQRSAPAVPKKGTVKEEVESKPPPFERPKKEIVPKESPKIPKIKLPLPDDPDFKEVPPPTKKEPVAEDPKSIEQFVVPADEKSSKPGPQVRVGFFNHSERQILLEVNGEQLKIPSGQYVTLRLPRTFVWAEKDRKARDVVVPPDADGIEIVFRK